MKEKMIFDVYSEAPWREDKVWIGTISAYTIEEMHRALERAQEMYCTDVKLTTVQRG